MTQEKKYYTPEIQELHYGFECEVYCSAMKLPTQWNEAAVGYGFLGILENQHKLINDNLIRVKCLDKEDIESLGWTRHVHDDLYILETVNDSHRIEIFGTYTYINQTPFTIKNKSELKRLMQQLGIQTNDLHKP